MSKTPKHLGSGIAMQKDIFRLAAMLYSETCDTYSTDDAQLQMVKCVFASADNRCMEMSEIISNMLDIYKYHISEEEVEKLIRKSKKTFLKLSLDEQDVYKLTDEAYEQTVESQKKSIDYYIDQYISQFGILDEQRCRDAIHKYLYELTTTNINSYRVLYSGKKGFEFSDKELSVDIEDFHPDEKDMIHGFLSWEDSEKNIALGNIVYCCLEYCLLVNGDSPNRFLKGIMRKREVYLDTNIIFRALGINGISRQKVVEAFLKKCKQAKIKLIISMHTKNEFSETITHYVSQIAAFSRGDVYDGAYEQLADYTIYSFYDDWRKTHKGVSLLYFKRYIEALYKTMVSQYDIADDERIPRHIFDSEEFKNIRNRYSTEIRKTKQELRPYYIGEDYYYDYSRKDSHDATIVHYAELQRGRDGLESDIFVVSSDKSLRYWDMSRTDTNYPIVVYPSQLFLILIKLCGRSDSDFDSFVSFINIRTNTHQMTPDQANIILSGISSITEDIKTQKHLVSSICGERFQDIIQRSKSDEELYQKVQAASQKYLEDELQRSEDRIKTLEVDVAQQKEAVNDLTEKVIDRDNQLSKNQSDIVSATAELERTRRQINNFAEGKIMPLYTWKSAVLPIMLAVATVVFVAFVALQFLLDDKPWNVAVLFITWLKNTPFGLCVGDAVYVIDACLGGALWYALKKWMRNPFNKHKNECLKKEMIQNYISENKLE